MDCVSGGTDKCLAVIHSTSSLFLRNWAVFWFEEARCNLALAHSWVMASQTPIVYPFWSPGRL